MDRDEPPRDAWENRFGQSDEQAERPRFVEHRLDCVYANRVTTSGTLRPSGSLRSSSP